MDLETLEARKASIEQLFNSTQRQRDDLNIELNRIQGDYRTTVADIELIKTELSTPPPETDEPQEGEVVAPNGDVINKEEKEGDDATDKD